MNLWESAMTLLEDSRGNIKRLLGMHPGWAQLFFELYGDAAFPVAKIMRLSRTHNPQGTAWSAPPDPNFKGAWSDSLQQDRILDMDLQDLVYYTFGLKGGTQELLDMLKQDQVFAKAINSAPMKISAEDLEDIFIQASQRARSSKQIDPNSIFMKLEGGWYWLDLGTDQCDDEAAMMGHCGTDERGSLFSLRDPKNVPHVTITYNQKKNAVFQIKGKQNSLPVKKYWPAIAEFFKKTGAKLRDGEVRGQELWSYLQDVVGPEDQNDKVVARTAQGYVWVEDVSTPDSWILMDEGTAFDYIEDPNTFDWENHDGGAAEVTLSGGGPPTLTGYASALSLTALQKAIGDRYPGLIVSTGAVADGRTGDEDDDWYQDPRNPDVFVLVNLGSTSDLEATIGQQILAAAENDDTPSAQVIHDMDGPDGPGDYLVVLEPPVPDESMRSLHKALQRQLYPNLKLYLDYEHQVGPDDETHDDQAEQEALALEYARMMGPVAYAEALAGRRSVHEAAGGRILAYHGSNRRIDSPQSLDQVKAAWQAFDFGPGMYFTTSPRDAREYGMNLYEAELTLNNPLRVSSQMTPEMDRFRKAFRITDEDLQFSDEGLWHDIMGLVISLVQGGMVSKQAVMNLLKKMGHDGIIVPAAVVRESGANVTGDYVIIFDTSQINNWREAPREVWQSTQPRRESVVREFLTDLSSNRREALQMLSDIASEYWELLEGRGVDMTGARFLGAGNNGAAWQLADGRVLKITTDDREAKVAAALRGKQFKHIFTIHDVWAFPGKYGPEGNEIVYGLITEAGLTKPSTQEQDEFDDMATVLMQVEQDSGHAMEDNFRNTLRYMMADPDIDPKTKQRTLLAVKKFDVPGMMADMKRVGFPTDLHSGNFMRRQDGTYVIIDIGTGGNDEDDTPTFEERLARFTEMARPRGSFAGPMRVALEWAKQQQEFTGHDFFRVWRDAGGQPNQDDDELAYRGFAPALRKLVAPDEASTTVLTPLVRTGTVNQGRGKKAFIYRYADTSAGPFKGPGQYKVTKGTTVVQHNDDGTTVDDYANIDLPNREGLDRTDGLNEVGILGAPQAGSGSQMRGMGSTAWSGGKLVLADPKDHVPVDEEDEEARYLDQDSKSVNGGANSPY